jgi:hypothetical protein
MKIQGNIPGYNPPVRTGVDGSGKKVGTDKNTNEAGTKGLPNQGQSNIGINTQDQYIPSQSAQGTQATANSYGYGKPGLPGKDVGNNIVKPDTATIERLKEESERTYSNLRNLVKQLLERQGLTFEDLKDFKGEIKVDEQARTEAAAAIADGGPLSAEAVSDRIVEFAKAVSGGDKSKLDTLRSSIDQGFAEAEKLLGGSLPEISHQTRDLINQKLDAWANEEG